MPQILAGPGQLVPLIYTYPQSVFNAPFTQRGNMISIPAGAAWPIPSTGPTGWWVEGAPYCVLQFFDPVTQIWRGLSSVRRGPMRFEADGFNYRIANLTGCPVAAVVTGSGTGFVQASTTVTAGTGTSTWYPVVGGTLTVTVITAGANYGLPPFIVIDPPQQQGVQATAYAAITSGTISAITVDNMGAGYLSAPNVQIVTNPADPNITSGITVGTAGAALISANQGKVVAVLCTNPGVASATAAVPALTITGGGTATCSAVVMSTITGMTVTGAGGAVSTDNLLLSVGGRNTYTPAFTNPAIELTGYIPRQANFLLAVGSGTVTTISQTYDSGLFTGTPNALLLSQSALSTTATIAFNMGSTNDGFMLQPT